MYFQIPLMVLVILPALEGLRPAWREAASNLGAGAWQYWRYVGGPVLLPSFLGCVLLLFGSAFSAYATAEALTSGSVPLTAIQIGSFLNGNVLAGQQNVGQGARARHDRHHRDRDDRLRGAAAEVGAVAAIAGGTSPRTWKARSPRAGPAGPAMRQFPVWRWVILHPGRRLLRHPAGRGAAVHRLLRPSRRSSTRKASPRPSSCRSSWPSITTVLTIVLMLPTTVYVHLRLPRLRRLHGRGHDPAHRDPAGGPDRGRAGDGARIPEEHSLPARR